MNAEQLAALGKAALAWSKAYVALKEALISQGVQSPEAERVARDTVNLVGVFELNSGEPCPLCGRTD